MIEEEDVSQHFHTREIILIGMSTVVDQKSESILGRVPQWFCSDFCSMTVVVRES